MIDSSSSTADNSQPTADFTKMPAVSVISDEKNPNQQTYIVRDNETLQRMLDSQRIFQGMKTVDEMQAMQADQKQEEDQVKKIVIPADKFQDFKVLTKENEEDFEYVVNCVIVQFLDKCPDTALEFPACLDGDGRAKIHYICNFLGIASHSQGTTKRNRRIIIYPKHLY
jgi:hypothetical protein